VRILQGIPYLRVRDVQRSIAFYVDGLGFELKDMLTAEDGLFWARVQNGPCDLMLCHRPSRFVGDDAEEEHEHDENGRHVYRVNAVQNGELNLVTYLYVEDANAAHAELKAHGVQPLDEPEDKFYGVREFLVCDPDGYYYAIAQRLG
jgi:uncharacterized glyoxalase superfamily protein PhnB